MEAQQESSTEKYIGRYQFGDTSSMARVDVEKGLNGGFQIALYPSESASAELLETLPDKLAELKAYGAYVSVREDKPVFIVPKVEDHKVFVAALQSAGITTDANPQYEEVKDPAQSQGAIKKLLHFLQDHTLEAAGISGGIGYLALGVDGLIRGDKFLAGTGIAALCPLILAIWGNGDKSGELTRLVGDVEKYLGDQGIEVPEQKFTAEQKHALSGLADFFKEHPVEISYALANIATAALWMQGLKEFKDDGAWTKLLTASTTLVGNTIVATFPEKHAKPESEMTERELAQCAARNPLERARDFIQESPLFIHMGLNLADILCWTKEFSEDSFKDKKIGNFAFGRDHKLHELGEKHGDLSKEWAEFIRNKPSGLNAEGELKFSNQANELQGKILDKQAGIDYLTNPKKEIFGAMTKAEASGVLKTIVATGLSLQIILGGMSHKSKSEEEQIAGFDKVFSASAKMLVGMPDAQRDIVLEQSSAFLALHKSTGGLMTAEKIKAEITKRLEVMKDAAWLNAANEPIVANNIVPLTRKGESVDKEAPQPHVSDQQLAGKVVEPAHAMAMI
jgi:hypothetical protein